MSHLDEIRDLGPTNETSSFPFEAFFAYMKYCYRTRTLNIGKQIMENFFLDYVHSNRRHRCKKSMVHDCKKKGRTDDRWIYRYNEREKTYEFYQVFNVSKSGKILTVRRVDTNCFEAGNLEWEKVGVYIFDRVQHEDLLLNSDDIDGKAIVCEDLILSIPYATVMENR